VAELVEYNLRYENPWYPDFNELENMDLSGVKIMWVNYTTHAYRTAIPSIEIFENW
jgi:hypothetical protein